MMNLAAQAVAAWLLAVPSVLNSEVLRSTVRQSLYATIAAKPLPEFLASSDNDLITIRQSQGGAARSDLVSVCLANNSRSGGLKAFDNRPTANPRFKADIGRRSCAKLHPTRHGLTFWKADAGGALKPVLKQSFNLSGHAGYEIQFDWIDD